MIVLTGPPQTAAQLLANELGMLAALPAAESRERCASLLLGDPQPFLTRVPVIELVAACRDLDRVTAARLLYAAKVTPRRAVGQLSFDQALRVAGQLRAGYEQLVLDPAPDVFDELDRIAAIADDARRSLLNGTATSGVSALVKIKAAAEDAARHGRRRARTQPELADELVPPLRNRTDAYGGQR